ncbi:MAG: PAS domain S-box protein [Pseudomonadota bacterium]
MKNILFTSLRTRLMLSVFLIMVPILGLLVYQCIEGRNEDRLNALDNARGAAQNISYIFGQNIVKTRNILFALSQMPQFRWQDSDACSMILANLLKETEIYTGLAAVKPNGKVYASAPLKALPATFADRPYFQRLVQKRRFVIGEYLIGRLSGKPTLILGYPVLDNTGQIITAFVVGLELEKLQKMIREVDLPEGANLTVIDSNGTILIRFPDPERFVGKKMLEKAVVKTMLTKKKGVMEKVGLDEVPRLFGYETIGRGLEAIHIGVGIPEQVAYANLNRITIRNFTLLGLISVLAFLGAWLFGGRLIISPVNRLIDVTNQLADGDLTTRTGLADIPGELGLLASNFDQMAGSLQRHEEELRKSEARLHVENKRAKILLELYFKAPSLSDKELYDYALDKAVYLTGSTIGFFHLVDEDQKTIVLTTWNSEALKGCTAAYDTHYSIEEAGNWVDCVRQGKPIIYNDFSVSPNQKGLPEGHTPLKRFMSIPVIEGGKIHYIFGVGNKSGVYEEHDVVHIQLIANELTKILKQRKADKTIKIFSQAIEGAIDGVTITDMEGIITSANPAIEDGYGYEKGELLGKSVACLDANPESASEIMSSLIKEASWGGEIEAIKKSGETFPALLSLSIVKDDREKPIAMMGICKDITERRQAEEALRMNEEKYRSHFENVSDVIFSFDREFKVLSVSPSLEQTLGYKPEEFIGKPFPELNIISPEYLEKALSDGMQTLAGENVVLSTFEFIARDGTKKDMEISSSPLIREGQVVAVISVARDITERKQMEEQLKRRFDRLEALRAIDMAITASLDMRVTFSVFLEQVINTLGVDAADVLLLNTQIYNRLKYIAGRGFRTSALKYTDLPLGTGYAGRAAQERKTISILDLQKESQDFFKQSPQLSGEDFVTYYGTPLIAKGEVRGVLEVFNRTPLEPEQEWLDFLEALATQAAIAVDNAQLFDNLQKSNIDLLHAYDDTLEGWSKALDLRDKETEGHSQRVTEMTLRLAGQMGIRDSELMHVRRGALLHDIGKMGIPDPILLKPGALNNEEWELMRKHPVYAYELLTPISYLRLALDIPYCHHEKWDGTGYPRELKGEHIPLAARIFAVVDVWDALCSERPYRPAWPEEKVREHIKEQTGKHFDPKVVEAFFELLNESKPE